MIGVSHVLYIFRKWRMKIIVIVYGIYNVIGVHNLLSILTNQIYQFFNKWKMKINLFYSSSKCKKIISNSNYFPNNENQFKKLEYQVQSKIYNYNYRHFDKYYLSTILIRITSHFMEIITSLENTLLKELKHEIARLSRFQVAII